MNERSSSFVGLCTFLMPQCSETGWYKKTNQNLLLTNYLFLIVKCQVLSARCNHTWIRRQNVKSCLPPEALHINFEEEMRRDGEKIVSNEPNGVIFFPSSNQKSELQVRSPPRCNLAHHFLCVSLGRLTSWCGSLTCFSLLLSAAGFSQ